MSFTIKDHTYLVTGGAGFIGSHLTAYLLANNARKVRVLDNLSTGFLSNIEPFQKNPSFEFLEGDIRDLETCKEACSGIEYVLHQAALGSVPRSVKDPITTNDVNVNGFLNMLVAARDEGVKRFIYAASSSTYGDSTKLPKTEDHIGKPLSPYAVTKYVNELYADVFYRIYKLETIGLRYFNVFGPRQSPSGAYAAVIPLFLRSVIEGTSPTINGDGSQTRDFTYVDNAVQANIKAIAVSNPSAINQVYNIAVGERTSLTQLWEYLKILSGSSLAANYGPERFGDIKDSLADISKAQKMLDYFPIVTLKEGLEKTLFWFRGSQELFSDPSSFKVK